MNEAIKTAAKALFKRAAERDVVDVTPEEWDALKDDFALDARAVIASLRDPPPQAVAFAKMPSNLSWNDGLAVWHGIIDAMLEEARE